jgi:hypothetical protein
MNVQMHYIVTFCALVTLGLIIKKPGFDQRIKAGEHVCKMVKGKMDCYDRDSDYRINKNSVVLYRHYEQ